MIKVFQNRVYLYTVTTALFSLFQSGVGVCANTEESREFYTDVSPVMSDINVTVIGRDGDIERDRIPIDGHEVSDIINSLEEADDGSSFASISPNRSRMSGYAIGYEAYDQNGERVSYLYHDGLHYICDNCINTINGNSYKITNENVSKYRSNLTAMMVKGIDTKVTGKNITVGSQIPSKVFKYGVSVSENGKIVLKSPDIKNTNIALYASDGIIEVDKGVIEESQKAVEATGNSFVVLEDTKIKTRDGKASLLSYRRSEVWMSGGSVDFMNSHGISSTLGGKVNLDGVKITGKGEEKNPSNHAVLHTDLGGPINFKGTINAVNVHGILSENTVATFNSILPLEDLSDNVEATEVNLESSDVTVNGNNAYGIYFKGEKPWEELDNERASEEEKTPRRLEVVNLQRTMFSAQNNAIYSTDKTSGVVSLTQSTLSSDNLLLKAVNGASVAVLAVSSTLEGGVDVDETSTAKFYLGDGSTWILQKKRRKEQGESALKNVSSVSLVNLKSDSSIKFTSSKPDQNYSYQTLKIGKGTGEVYKATDGADIYLNTYLNSGGPMNNQNTDRVLIDGDVSGKTTVHVQGVSGSPGALTGNGGNDEGISIIQVSGSAHEDSFLLEGGYVTAGHSPYQYQLYAYGPQSALGKASTDQRLVKGSGDFWDFRLENRYVVPKPDPAPAPSPTPLPPTPLPPSPTPPPAPGPAPEPHPKPEVKAVVPQVPTYLLLPNALFQAGLMNINSQNNRLESLRIASGGLLKSDEQPAFFVGGYGGSYRYASNLSALEYGYGGELDYHTIEAGALLQTIENAHSNASFGVIGSYGKLSLQPLDVEQSQKSTFDKWSVTAYGGIQHDAGCYVDGLLSYGLFKGDVVTLARGKTATLKGKPLSASVTAGKMFMIGDESFVVDPQVQVVYQHLRFDKAHDVDDFDIEMGKVDQWVARVGGRLTKTLSASDEARVVAFYGKLHLSHGLGGKQSVHFKDAFQLGAFGSSLEAGLGFNAKLSQKFALHGDVVYQHKLTKAGFSGASFSGGIRYHF